MYDSHTRFTDSNHLSGRTIQGICIGLTDERTRTVPCMSHCIPALTAHQHCALYVASRLYPCRRLYVLGSTSTVPCMLHTSTMRCIDSCVCSQTDALMSSGCAAHSD